MKIKSSSVGMNLAEVEERDVTCDMFNFFTIFILLVKGRS